MSSAPAPQGVGIGLAVPVDIAGIGADNIALAHLAFPPLTTIDQNTQLIASRLAAALVDGIAGKVPQEHRQRDALSVIRRESALGASPTLEVPALGLDLDA